MGVAGGGADLLVPEQLADHCRSERPRRVAVTEVVDSNIVEPGKGRDARPVGEQTILTVYRTPTRQERPPNH